MCRAHHQLYEDSSDEEEDDYYYSQYGRAEQHRSEQQWQRDRRAARIQRRREKVLHVAFQALVVYFLKAHLQEREPSRPLSLVNNCLILGRLTSSAVLLVKWLKMGHVMVGLILSCGRRDEQ